MAAGSSGKLEEARRPLRVSRQPGPIDRARAGRRGTAAHGVCAATMLGRSDTNPLAGVLEMLVRPPALTLLAGVIFAGSLLLSLVNFAETRGPLHANGEMCCGDFTSFWTGGVFVSEGRGAALYDLGAQREYQSTLTGRDLEYYQPYDYPPIVALVVAPMTRLGFPGAFAAFGLFSALLAFAGLALLWPCLDGLTAAGRGTACLAALAFAPIVETMLGGQTTAITFALFCAHFAAVRRGWPIAAGVVLGLLAYKPQFTLLLLLWHLVRVDGRVFGAAAACGIVQYLAGAAVAGFDWPLHFLAAAHTLGTSASWAAAESGFLSLPSALGWSLGPAGRAAGWVASAGVVAAAADAARRVGPASRDFATFYALLVIATLLANPYVNYYDYGIVALPAMLYVSDREKQGGIALGGRLAVGAAWLGYPVWEMAGRIGFQPLVVPLVAAFFAAWFACRRVPVPRESSLGQRIAAAGPTSQA